MGHDSTSALERSLMQCGRTYQNLYQFFREIELIGNTCIYVRACM